MTPSRRRASQLFLGCMTVFLASTLLFLYIKSSNDQTASYTQSRDLIRQLQQLNAQWDSEVLKARIAITQNYDPLVTPLTQMTRLWAELEVQDAYHNPDDLPGWHASQKAYREALKEKSLRVEQFKSHNAVLRNSLAFLPTAEDDIQVQFNQVEGDASVQLQSVVTDTYDLLLSSLEFAQATTAERAADILVGLGKLAVNKALLPSEFHAPLDILSNHIQLILREQPLVNRLLEQIAAIPLAARLDDLTTHLNLDQQAADRIERQYHRYLLVFSTLLVALLLYLAIRLLRSFTEINRTLHAANETLEHRVERRTRALTEASAALQLEIDERKHLESQLVQSEKLASLGQLAAGVAHEINNPVGFISSNLNTLDGYFGQLQQMLEAYRQAEEGSGASEQSQQLKALRDSLELDFLKDDIPLLIRESKEGIGRVVQIVKDLKNFSRVDNDQTWQFANLQQGIDSTLNIVASELKYKADVVKHYQPLPEIECLASQLNQVVMNLVINAAQAMGPQRGTITISNGVDGENIWLEVADNGCGIPPQALQKIFDPFFTTKPVGEGTGLGLSLSYGIVKKHRGDISVSSEPGKGTTFRVVLPIRQTVA